MAGIELVLQIRKTKSEIRVYGGNMNTIWSEHVQGIMTLYLSRKLRFDNMFFDQYKSLPVSVTMIIRGTKG